MIGDRPETDGLFAQRLGCRFALVRSGVTPARSPSPHSAELRVDADVADLAEVADGLLPGRAPGALVWTHGKIDCSTPRRRWCRVL